MKKIILLLAIFICFIMNSCSGNRNDIDTIVSNKWQECGRANNCIIDFANAMHFKWDTMCFYSAGNSLEDINKDLDFELKEWTDSGDRVIFLYKGKIVYQKEWALRADEPLDGVVFETDLKKFKINKANAKFRIRKEENAYYLKKL
ncbi:hypothetical protein [Chryseobacterium sp.]|uniref:hypothetical protein n=1 Tax=Chryseobacterium sp. TaxID=1871047 RepID=UPI0025C5E6C2|nr:hypothetical protein [Chryseobacterium sp.]MBV8326504.1 hypothetical protein [Chryseobacterium sp.]